MEDQQYFAAEAGAEVILLIIAEDKDVGEILAEPLKQRGYLCEVAEDVEQGFEWLRTLQPNMILLDFIMSGSNGLEFLKTLRAHPEAANVPVLFFSPVPRELLAEVREYGPCDSISEAYNSDALAEKIEMLLG